MMENYLNLNENDLIVHVPPKYYFQEKTTKFIYSSLKTGEVIGLSNLLTGSVIEVKKKKSFKNKEMSFITLQGQDIGWINLEDSIRAFRLPNIQGKFKHSDEISKSNEKGKDLKNRIIKASYIYIVGTEQYLLVNKVGDKDYFKIHIKDFNRISFPSKNIYVELKAGINLFKDSKLNRVEKQLEENGKFKVVSYFENLDELRISVKGDFYWIKYDEDLMIDTQEELDNINYEIIDMIVYLKNRNKINKNLLKNQSSRLKNIESNIEVSNDLQELYLTKYIGDIHES